MSNRPSISSLGSPYARLLEAIPDAAIIVNRAGQIVLANLQAAAMFGYQRGELPGQPLHILVPEASRSHHARDVDRYFANPQVRPLGTGLRLSGRRRDGSEFPLDIMLSPILEGDEQLALGVIRDQASTDWTQLALLESDVRYRSLFENMLDGVAYCRMLFGENQHPQDFIYLDVNHAFETLTGWTAVVGKRATDVIPGLRESNPELFEICGRVALTGQPERFEVRLEALRSAWLAVSAYSVQREYFVAVFEDITERKQAEAELTRERNLLRTLIDNVPDFIYVKDAAGRFTLVNRAIAGSLGRTPEEVVGQTNFDLLPPELAARLQADEQAVMQSGQPQVEREELLYDQGQERWQLTTTVPLRDGSGQVTGLVGLSRNITGRRQAELELQQRLAELEAVNQISKAVRTAQSLDEMLPVWLDVTLAMMHANGGSVWLYDSGANELRPAVTRGWVQTAWSGPVPPQKPGVGVNGHVFVTGQPYVSGDFRQDPHLAPGVRDRIPPGGGAAIPIRVGDQIIGTFVVNTPAGRAVTPGEVHLLTTLSEIAGSAIHRMRLLEQTEQRLNRITTLRAIDAAITASLDVRVTLDVFLAQVLQQLGVHAANVLLLDPDSRMLQYAAGRGFRTRDFEHVRVYVGEGRAGRVALERRTLIVSDGGVIEAPSRRTASLQREDFVCYLGVPLIAKGQVLGVLEIFHRAPLQTNPEWLEFLETLAGQAAIAIDNARLFDNLQRANQGLVLAYDATIEGWSAALDLRDKETEGHTQRVTDLTERLARVMGLSDAELVHIRRGALLHDIGKMGIPDAILLKPGPLTDEEWAIMRQHPTYAYRLLAPIDFLRPALAIPYCHHEKWDGTGYPRGLSREQIPLAARVFAVVDVWDALRSHRPYRAAWPADRVLQHLRSLAGTHFDPQIANVALESGLFLKKGNV